MDVFDRRAAIGLRVGRRSHSDRRLDAAWAPSHEWWFYNRFRQMVALTAQAADCGAMLETCGSAGKGVYLPGDLVEVSSKIGGATPVGKVQPDAHRSP